MIGYVTKVFEYIRDEDLVPLSMTEAVTVLIQKDGDRTDPSNQRPISLLNADYKWLMKYINEFFVQPSLEKIITEEQLCAVKGRSIHDGLCLIRDLIEYSRTTDCKGFIVSLDQRKAFNLLSHDVLFAAMEHFKLPRAAVNMVRTLYRGVTRRISINGQLSEELQIERGVRQGSPLSASLYVIYLQLFLGLMVRKDAIQGIKVPGGVLKMSAYADDLVVFCNDQSDISKTFSFFDKVFEISGSQLNQNKTKILCLSDYKPMAYCDLMVDELKICGIFLSNRSREEITSANQIRIFDKIKQKAARLAGFSITLRGRVLISNMILISQLNYISGVYLPSKSFFEEVRKRIFQFIWGEGRREVISRKSIETSVKKGGPGLVRMQEKWQALHLEQNLYRPCSNSFNHQRLLLYTYFFGFWTRKMAPHTYSIIKPHRFALCGVYVEVDRLRKKLWEHMEKTGFHHVSVGQSCRWLVGEEDSIVFKVPREVDFDLYRERVFAIWSDGVISMKNLDFMWRIALGGIKTGDYIARYKMPGFRIDCVFCPEVKETAEHLFYGCKSLSVVRSLVFSSIKDIGIDCSSMTDEQRKCLFCLGLGPGNVEKLTQRKIFSMIAETNRVIWSIRNEVLFSYERNGVEKVTSLVRPIMSRIKNEVSFTTFND